ncbi:MAG: N utilization substance protein B [Candidatus Krumholzibacteriia bacterium]
MGKRRKGREIVLQSMYASLISGSELVDTLEDQFLQRESADETKEFARDLTKKVKAHGEGLDRWLTSMISDRWDRSRLGTLEVVILTIGLAEIKHSPDVPYRVVINEACELTRRYCDESAIGFINAVLDRAVSETYPDLKQSADASGEQR